MTESRATRVWLPLVDAFRTLACSATPVLSLEMLGQAGEALGA